VNLVSVRAAGGVHVAGTLFGKQETPRIVGIDDHSVDLPPSSHLLVVHNDDRPGMIGQVTTALADSDINISDIHVGRSAAGESALMAIATDTPVGPAIVERIGAMPGIHMARSIALD
jgi:D-3-phosphoglycerate dehydrogenase